MENLIAVSSGVLAGLIAQFLWNPSSSKLPMLRKPEGFTLSGVYAMRLKTPIIDGEFLELIKIKQRGDILDFYMENYKSDRPAIWRYRGKGYYRNTQIAISYSPLDRSKPNIGVISLRNTSLENGDLLLSGIFAQLIDLPEKEIYTLVQRYYLQKINVSFIKQIRNLLNNSCYKSYGEFKLDMENKGTWELMNFRPNDKCKVQFDEN